MCMLTGTVQAQKKELCLHFCGVSGWRGKEMVEPGPAGGWAFCISAHFTVGPGAGKALAQSQELGFERGK